MTRGSFKCMRKRLFSCCWSKTHTSHKETIREPSLTIFYKSNRKQRAPSTCTSLGLHRHQHRPLKHLCHFYSTSDLANPVKADFVLIQKHVSVTSFTLKKKKKIYHIVVRPHMAKKQNFHPTGKLNIIFY